MKMYPPMVPTELVTFTLKPGQVTTAWLDSVPHDGARNARQVELRVTRDGRRQIFVDPKEVEVLSFDQWTDGQEGDDG